MLLNHEDGAYGRTPEESEDLKNLGFLKCYNPQCNFFLAPDTQQTVLNKDSGYYTCPNSPCKQSHDIMEDVPWHGVDDDYFEFRVGGGTRIGISMEEQAQIGEDLIEQLGSLPGYGPIIWWHHGGSGATSPLDGATKEWGIEVKTIGYDAIHHRFVPGSADEKEAKNQQAKGMGLKGILGLLVMLNYRTSLADVYIQEMPLAHWRNVSGRMMQGISTFRTTSRTRFLERVPFTNPLIDPLAGAPQTASQDDPPF